MIDAEDSEKTFSPIEEDDEAELFDPVAFDPETTFVANDPNDDDDVDSDTLAFRDAVRDICRAEGRFDLILP